jgi:hypothetical protein
MRYLILLTMLTLATPAGAEVTVHLNFNQWKAAVGFEFTTIGFFELGPPPQFITDEYIEQGLLFTDGNDNTAGPGCMSYVLDCWGLQGNGPINITFTEPRYWVAAHFPGDLGFDLFIGKTMIYTGGDFGQPGAPPHFAGLVSTEPFDRVKLYRHKTPSSFIDNLYFGGPPAPCQADIAPTGKPDGVVGPADLAQLLASWGQCPNPPTAGNCTADIHPVIGHDRIVGPGDLAELLSQWGQCGK